MKSTTIVSTIHVLGTDYHDVSVFGLYSKPIETEATIWIEEKGVEYYRMETRGEVYGALLREDSVPKERVTESLVEALFLQEWPEKVELIIASFTASYSGLFELLNDEPWSVYGWRDLRNDEFGLTTDTALAKSEAWICSVRNIPSNFRDWH